MWSSGRCSARYSGELELVIDGSSNHIVKIYRCHCTEGKCAEISNLALGRLPCPLQAAPRNGIDAIGARLSAKAIHTASSTKNFRLPKSHPRSKNLQHHAFVQHVVRCTKFNIILQDLFSNTSDKLQAMMKRMFASLGGSVRPRTLCSWVLASQLTQKRSTKINLIIDYHRSDISEIKLKRTDTTLDLSQKAERAISENLQVWTWV